MIRYSEKKYCPELMEMWKLCFPTDSDEFIRFYFNEVYKDGETLILLENDRIVASLQVIPYQMKIEGALLDAGYISGAMTHPDHRRKGYMERLLLFSFEEMKNNNVACSFLIPQEKWLIDFYQKYGYQRAFHYSSKQILLPGHNEYAKVYASLNEININSFYAHYNRFLMEKDPVVLKTEEQFEKILQDHFIDRGIVLVHENGIGFALLDEGTVVIKELLYHTEEANQALLTAIGREFKQKEAIIFIREKFSGDSMFSGMVKPIDPHFVIRTDIYMSMMLD